MKLHIKNNKNTYLWSNLTKQHFIFMFRRYILTFNAKKNFKKNYQTYMLYPFKTFDWI